LNAKRPDKPHNREKPYYPCTTFDNDYYDQAPQRYVSTVELPCTPAQVFEVFEDPGSWPQWARPGIADVIWTSPKPYGVGTTRTVVFTGGMEVYEDFIGWEAGKYMAFCFYGVSQDDVFNAFGERYEVEDNGDGTCRLRWTVAYEPGPGFARVHFLVRPSMRLTFKLYMWQLKRYCRRQFG